MNGCRGYLCGLAAAAGLALGAAAEEARGPVSHFDQAYVEEAVRTSTLDVNDPMASRHESATSWQ